MRHDDVRRSWSFGIQTPCSGSWPDNAVSALRPRVAGPRRLARHFTLPGGGVRGSVRMAPERCLHRASRRRVRTSYLQCRLCDRINNTDTGSCGDRRHHHQYLVRINKKGRQVGNERHRRHERGNIHSENADRDKLSPSAKQANGPNTEYLVERPSMPPTIRFEKKTP